MSDTPAIDVIRELYLDPHMRFEEFADALARLEELQQAAEAHWENVRKLSTNEIAASSRSASNPTGVFATLGPLAAAVARTKGKL